MLDETVIPEGPYCYTIKKIEYEPLFRIKLNLCPYWIYDVTMDRIECTFCNMNGIPYNKDWDALLSDQCKICGVNEEIDEHKVE